MTKHYDRTEKLHNPEEDGDGLRLKDYYETRVVNSGKGNYYCSECHKTIEKGSSSEVHKFYPEFRGFRTHPRCSQAFINKLVDE